MATNSKVFVSPGVYTSEVDLSFVAQSVGVTTLGIVGETIKGPAFEPIFVRNYDEYQQYFGGTLPEKFVNTQIPKYEASYIAKAYLQQSNQLFVTRILGLSGYDAGPSWSITTSANLNPSTLDYWCLSAGTTPQCLFDCLVRKELPFVVDFSACTLGEQVSYLTTFPIEIQNILASSYENFDGSFTTLQTEINNMISNIITSDNVPLAEETTINYYGSVPQNDYNFLTAAGYTAFTNVMDVDNVVFELSNPSASSNDTWYYALFQNTNAGLYSGFSFFTTVTGLSLTNTYTLVNPFTPFMFGPSTTTTTSMTPNFYNLVITVAPGSVVVEYCLTANFPVTGDVTLGFDITLGVLSGLPIIIPGTVTLQAGEISGCTIVSYPNQSYQNLDLTATVTNLTSTDPAILDVGDVTINIVFTCDPILPVTTTTTEPPIPNLCYTGSIVGMLYYYTGTSYTDYDDLVVTTLRSRGISTYANEINPLFEVTGVTDVTLDMTGQYQGALKNPFSTFSIGVTNYEGTEFDFEVSLSAGDAKNINKVFGRGNFEKPRTQVPLMIEESYLNLLNYAWSKGYIRGLRSKFTTTEGAQSNDTTSLGYYLERFQSPSTPWVVSELRGNKVYNMFKVYSISDGNTANTEIKISFTDLSFNNETFTVLVRDYFDTDSNPVVLEKFTSCSMDPSQNNFIAKKIGTLDGEYELKSKYILIEMNEDAPVDSIPCGFEGYTFREYPGSRSPFPIYKTKYFTPGETVFNPPFGLASGGDDAFVSAGDNVRRTYLGISSYWGWDSDFFQYKGKRKPFNICDGEGLDWNFKTKGFHMDQFASGITINSTFASSGTPAFECGVASFSSEPTNVDDPYYRLNARKFTTFVYGGFDGWDIYREYRTNGDKFTLGRNGFLNGACPSVRYPKGKGNGLFKQIAIGDGTIEYGNTDYYAYMLGIRTFANPEAVNINLFTTPGIDLYNNSDLVERTIDMIENERADSLYITTMPDYNMFLPTTTGQDGLIYPQEAVDLLEETGIDSNYTATYYPWVLTRDTVNNTQIYIPATAEVTRNMALTDNIAFPWFAAAGYTRGIVNAIKARKKLTQEDRDVLYLGRINPIATFADVGTVIWGNKTLQVRESALDRINVRRLLLQARKLISAVSVRLLFDQNDQQVRQDFLNAVNPILDAIRRDRGLYDFRVTVSNDTEDLDKNQMVGKIYIKPTKSLEFIDITFYITPTGASFDDV
jgi:hypothetical protein